MRDITDAQKIAAFDALCRLKYRANCTRATPTYEWTITSRHCDLASALLEMIPPAEEYRPWPKWRKEPERKWSEEQGIGFFGFI